MKDFQLSQQGASMGIRDRGTRVFLVIIGSWGLQTEKQLHVLQSYYVLYFLLTSSFYLATKTHLFYRGCNNRL